MHDAAHLDARPVRQGSGRLGAAGALDHDARCLRPPLPNHKGTDTAMSMVTCPTHGIQYPDYFPASCPICRQHSIDMAALERQIERRKNDIRQTETTPEVRTWPAEPKSDREGKRG